MQIREVEYAIVGVGTAGLGAYSRIRRKSDSLVLIQHGPYGTTCARVGCMPSKMLIAAADIAHAIDEGEFFGINGSYSVDGKRVFERLKKDRAERFVGGVLKAVGKIPAKYKIEGQAVFVDPHTLQVGDDLQIKAKKIILACGSTPAFHGPFAEIKDEVDSSDTIFELDDLPESIAVAGLGVIALELGQAFHRLGVKTRMFGHSGRIGGFTHPEMQKETMAVLSEELDIVPRGEFIAARKTAHGFELQFERDTGEVITHTCERVLVASGRESNLRSMKLENSGLDLDSRALPKYDPLTMRCGDSHIYVAGDVTEDLPLWHEAYIEGRIAGESAVSTSGAQEGQRIVPLGIFYTDPQMATVGAAYAELNQDEIVIGKVSMGKGPRQAIYNDARGMLQIYANKADGRILGAEIFGRGAEHMGHTLALAIEYKATVDGMLQMPFYHPCLEEVIKDALYAAKKQLN
ncbi:MAG: dihydrolipoyl dehydrogenase [Desulfuromonadaceae bacterium]|nr:dihydrolipoyl dehydrogenase [Desulfuromonadaceae bacterium]